MIVTSVAFASSSTSLGIAVSQKIIDALDKGIRNDLQNASQLFFVWVLVSAAVVAVGVALEGPEILHEMWPRLFVWFTWPSAERLHKFERTVKTIGLWGWLLVVIGVMGEGIFEGLQNRAEGQLQTFNDILLRDARLTASTAKQSALDAADASARAKMEADAASSVADKARYKADAVGQKADDLDRQLANTENELTSALERTKRLEAQLSWRTVTPEQAEIIGNSVRRSFPGKLLPLSGVSISFVHVMGDEEGSEYCDEITDVLHALGASTGDGPSAAEFNRAAPKGVIIVVNSAKDPVAVPLQRALRDAGIEAPGEIGKDLKGIEIIVGVKPRPELIPHP